MPDFPKIGVAAVVDGVSTYLSNLKQMQTATTDTSKQIDQAAKATEPLTKGLTSTTSELGNMAGALGGAEGALGGMAGAAGAAVAVIGPLVVVIGAVAAAVGGFLALAQRGAGFSEIESSFGNLTAAINQNAEALITNLHAASEGTVSDFVAMQTVNRALLGTTKEFGTYFGQSLPQLMRIAKATAEVTGASVTATFDQITEAVKRGQTRLLMQSGIVINQKQALEDWAKAHHTVAAAMDQTQRQEALLQAVLAKGEDILKARTGAIESNADKQERLQATLTNLADKASAVVQPMFAAILDAINSLMSGISDAFGQIAPYLGAIASILADGIRLIAQPIVDFLKSVLHIPAALGGSAKNFFDGGARIMGALAAGIIQVANTVILPAILWITQTIADFLIGLSPPPKGPLSLIDQGGYNTMEAWITGFTGVSLDPVEQVAAQVNSTMGSIGGMGLDAVKLRLAELDKALQPFQERLKIVQDQFDAIKPATDAAFRAIDRQLAKANEALKAGDVQAAETVKQLDAQKAALQEYVDTQQAVVDNATIQLAFAKEQQAAERSLLDIQQKRLGPAPKETKAAKEKIGGKAAAEAGAGEEALGAGVTPGAGAGFNILGDVEGAKAELSDQMMAGFQAAGGIAGVELAKDQASQIQANVNKIATVDIGAKLGEKFADAFDPARPTSVFYKLGEWVLDTFDPSRSTSIWVKIGTLAINAGSKLMGIVTVFETNFVKPIGDKVTGLIRSLVDPLTPGSIPFALTQLINVTIPTTLANIGQAFHDNLVQPITDKIDLINLVIDQFFNQNIPGVSLKWFINQGIAFIGQLPAKVGEALASFADILKAAIITPAVDIINKAITVIEQFLNTILDSIRQLAEAVRGLGGVFEDISNKLRGAKITLPRVPPPAAEGGLFGKGLLSVNPREEVIGSAEKLAVFPSAFVGAIDRLTRVIAQAAPAMPSAYSYTTQTNYNTTMTNNFTGINNSGDVVQALARMQAYR